MYELFIIYLAVQRLRNNPRVAAIIAFSAVKTKEIEDCYSSVEMKVYS